MRCITAFRLAAPLGASLLTLALAGCGEQGPPRSG